MSFPIKFLLSLLLLAAIAIAGLGIVGSKSVKHSTQITINAHGSDVFEWLVESEKIREWAPEIIDVASFESEDQEESVRTIQIDETELSYEDKVLRYDHGEMVSVRSTGRDLVQTQVFQLEPNDLGGTNLEFRLTRTSKGLGRFLVPFREDDSSKTMKRQMRKLKKLIEKQRDGMLVGDSQSRTVTSVSSPPEVSGDGEQVGNSQASDSQPARTAIKPPVKKVDVEANRQRTFRSLFGTG